MSKLNIIWSNELGCNPWESRCEGGRRGGLRADATTIAPTGCGDLQQPRKAHSENCLLKVLIHMHKKYLYIWKICTYYQIESTFKNHKQQSRNVPTGGCRRLLDERHSLTCASPDRNAWNPPWLFRLQVGHSESELEWRKKKPPFAVDKCRDINWQVHSRHLYLAFSRSGTGQFENSELEK